MYVFECCDPLIFLAANKEHIYTSLIPGENVLNKRLSHSEYL